MPANPQLNEAIAAGLEADDISTISDPVVHFFREFAESRIRPHSIADADPDLYAFAACARRASGSRTPEDVVVALRDTQVPVLVVVGDKDPVLPDGRLLTETAPNGKLVTVPGGDHLSTVASSAYKDAVACFLASSTLAAY